MRQLETSHFWKKDIFIKVTTNCIARSWQLTLFTCLCVWGSGRANELCGATSCPVHAAGPSPASPRRAMLTSLLLFPSSTGLTAPYTSHIPLMTSVHAALSFWSFLLVDTGLLSNLLHPLHKRHFRWDLPWTRLFKIAIKSLTRVLDPSSQAYVY